MTRLITTLVLALAALGMACQPLPPAPTPDASASTFVVGDSITWQLMWTGKLDAAHPEWDHLTGMGYQMSNVQSAITEKRNTGDLGTLVVALGVNDSRPWDLDDELRWTSVLLNLSPATRLVLVKPYVGPNSTFVIPGLPAQVDKARAFVDSVAGFRPNTVVVDWRDYVVPGVLATDDIHLAHAEGDPLAVTPQAAAARLAVLEAGLA